MSDFSVDLKKLCEKAAEHCDQVARKSLLAVGTSLVMKSPVGDGTLWKTPPPAGYVGGQFRANWQHGFAEIPAGTIQRVDPAGETSIGKIAASLDSGEIFGLHYFVNNLPYAQALENGHSTQAPAGMVELTCLEFAEYVRQATAEAKS